MKVEIELDDATGKPVGALPDAAQKLFNEAFGKGAEKAAKEAKDQMATIERELRSAKSNGSDPVAEEKIKALEIQLSKAREADALREKRYADAQSERDTRAQAEVAERDKALGETKAELDRRTNRIKALAANDIKTAALRHGALEKGLDQIAALLSAEIGLDESTLDIFVKDSKDATKVRADKDGKTVTVDGLVEQWLQDNPHFKASGISRPASGGGRALHSRAAGSTSDQAIARLEANPNDRQAIAEAWGAITDKAKARH